MTESRYDVSLTIGARHDLDHIHNFYSECDSGVDPDALIQKLLAKAVELDSFPLRGNVPKELDSLGIRDFRQVTLPPYRLIYRVIGDLVQILLIADGRRDMKALLETRLLG